MLKYSELVASATLTGVAVSYYTAPGSVQVAIHAVSVANPTGGAVTVNIYRVSTGGAASAANRIASRVIAAGGTASIPDAVNHKLAPGSQIFADGAGCALNISGVEYTPGT